VASGSLEKFMENISSDTYPWQADQTIWAAFVAE
jgi:hypothetical protein